MQRPWSDTDLADRHVRVDSRAVIGVHGLQMGVEIVIRKFPKFAFVAEGRFGQGGHYYFYKFCEEPAVVVVDVAVFVPMPYGGQVWADL